MSTIMRMTKTRARHLVRASRAAGWFRASLIAQSGWRRCPLCNVQLYGYGHGRDDAFAREVNADIDRVMLAHLLDNEDPCDGRL